MQFYEEKESFTLAAVFLRRLGRDLFVNMTPLAAKFARTERYLSFAEAQTLDYQPIAPGELWGKTWDTGYFMLEGAFPPPPEENLTPVCRINFGGEALLYSASGKALTGLTAYCWFANDFVREIYYPAPEAAIPSKAFKLFAAASASKFVGLDVNYDPDFTQPDNGTFEAHLAAAEAGYLRGEVQELIDDLKCLLSLAETFPAGDYRRRDFARAFDRAESVYADNPANASRARAELAPILARPAYSDALQVTAIGHAHLDTAYMWPVREGKEKCGRTFATQLELAERFPEYVFGASQPQHYAFVKAKFPELYERIKSAVAAGQWELQGGMWVEPDTNVPDGEALVRQFLHGKNFFRDEFGIEVKNLWLPDVFGYSAALPQIMKLAGCTDFVSIKLSWNDCNKFPYKTFRWRGLDGSEVMAHFPPEATYSSHIEPKALVQAANAYSESAETGEFLSLFGMGDGGGGASREDLSAGRRIENLAGAPRVRFGAAQPCLDRMHAHWRELPAWEGELYFEWHRGTLTAISRMKRDNRKSEQLLPAVEFLASSIGMDYPAAELDKAWKTLLLFQFHDIIAGSSIDKTYEEAAEAHRAIREAMAGVIARAAKVLPSAPDCVTLVNSLNTPYRGFVPSADGAPEWVELPPLSFTLHKKAAAAAPEVTLTEQPVLENELIRYEFDADLGVISAFDKVAKREIIPAGKRGNAFLLYRDYPSNYEAWNLDRHYLAQTPEAAHNAAKQVEVRKCGKFVELAATLTVGKSRIKQKVRLLPGSRQLDFETEVDWEETRRHLRVEFPLALHSDFGTYDVQFGAIRRPTGENTSWDVARFEVQHHKFMDLSENDYGAALLNDCKYGGRVWPDKLDLALLRSARFPAMHSEAGTQKFTYTFLPHPGTVVEARVAEAAEALNRPPLVLNGCDGSACRVPVQINTTSVALSACKRAEKSGDWIVRIVERYGKSVHAEVSFDAERFAAAGTSDLLEWEPVHNEAKGGKLELDFRPYEIKTVRLAAR